MREIKFRAWDKRNQIMVEPENIRNLVDGAPRREQKKPSSLFDCLYERLDDEAVILMQFTGLRDKAGREIYGGDILSVNWSIKNDSHDSEWKLEVHKAIIEWRRNGWFISWSYFSKPFDMGNKEICWYEDYNHSNAPGSFQKLTDFEIIGNVHENPELMGKIVPVLISRRRESTGKKGGL